MIYMLLIEIMYYYLVSLLYTTNSNIRYVSYTLDTNHLQ